MAPMRKGFSALGCCSGAAILALSLLIPSVLGQSAAAPSGEIPALSGLGQDCSSNDNVLADGGDVPNAGWGPLGDDIRLIQLSMPYTDYTDALTAGQYLEAMVTGLYSNATLMGLYKNVLIYNRDSGTTCFQIFGDPTTAPHGHNWVISYVDTIGSGETINLNVLVFDHGAVNHCGAPGGWANWGYTGTDISYIFTDSSSNNLTPDPNGCYVTFAIG